MSSACHSSNRRPRTLVTGAARRVGLAVACEFARRGHDLVMLVRALDARAEEAADAVRAASGGAATVEIRACDLDDSEAVSSLGASLMDGPIDALVHCAARYESQPIGQIDPGTALSHYRVNALAPLMLAQALRGALTSSVLPGGGAIVLFSDMHTQGRFYRGHASYFASKGAVDALVGALAVELAPKVRVNGIAPGVVAWPVDADEGFKARYLARTPLGRAGTPAEAAACAAWLAIDAHFVNGEIIRLDGGRWLGTSSSE